MLGVLAQHCTFIDDDPEPEFVEDAVETEEDEAETVTAEKMKKRSMMMTRKGSWHSHISQRSREHELSIGGITHITQFSTQTVHKFKTDLISFFSSSAPIPFQHAIVFRFYDIDIDPTKDCDVRV